MNKKLQMEIDRFNIKCTKFKNDLKDKHHRKRLVFEIIFTSITLMMIVPWVCLIIIPILHHITVYSHTKGFDPFIGLSSFAFTILGLWFITFPLSRIICYPIGKLLGVIGTKSTMPKGWKKQK